MTAKKVYFLLILIKLFICTASLAQESETGNWLMYFGSQPLKNNWNWHNEVQYRNYNILGDTEQLLLRTGIGHNLTEGNNNLLVGYAFIHTQRYFPNSSEKFSVDEHRIYQQFITRQQFNRVYIQHRYRIEQRFLPDAFRMRYRYFLALNIPLNNPTMVENSIYLSAYNEIFINGASSYFDRNRLYGALGYVINKFVRVEAGFMSQGLERSHRNQFQIAVFNNLPFTQ